MPEPQIIIKKVKVPGGHAHHGGSWKVAYADFVTAMMAFFMVMWLTNLSQDTKDKIQGYFNDPLGYMNTAPKSRTMLTMEGLPQPKPMSSTSIQNNGANAFKSEQTTLEKVMQRLKSAISNDAKFSNLSRSIRISLTPEGLVIELMETQGAVFFESGSSVIRPEAAKLIDTFAPILASAKHAIEVQGHTDAKPFPNDPGGNFRLGSERADALLTRLVTDGVTDFTGSHSYGPLRLLDPAHPFASINRRVTILLPRQYTAGEATSKPADDLANQVTGSNTPEAVLVKPTSANVLDRKESH